MGRNACEYQLGEGIIPLSRGRGRFDVWMDVREFHLMEVHNEIS